MLQVKSGSCRLKSWNTPRSSVCAVAETSQMFFLPHLMCHQDAAVTLNVGLISHAFDAFKQRTRSADVHEHKSSQPRTGVFCIYKYIYTYIHDAV